MGIEIHDPNLSAARAANRDTNLIAFTSGDKVDTQKALVINEKIKSTYRQAYGVHPARWTLPSGFPDYFQYDNPKNMK